MHSTRLLTTLLLTLAAPTSAAPPSEPYHWRSVIIKANGFIDGIVFSPSEKGLAYIHTDMGGAYRLDVAKDEWVCVTDWIKHDDWSLNQMGVETMAVDPDDASRVYAGIGTYMGPSAIVRSSDYGKTWQRTNVPFGMNGNGSARNAGERMNVDPNLGTRLIYGTRTRGVWISEDSGATWAAIESFPSHGDSGRPLGDTGVVWTLFDKSSGRPGQATPIAYAGVCTAAPEKVFRTLDAGRTWSSIPGQPDAALLPTRVALTRDGKSMFLTYVSTQTYPGPHGISGGGVYRVDNPASESPTWTSIAPASGNFGWSGVALDHQSPPSLYITTLNRYGEDSDDIYRSTDRGASWKRLNVKRHRDDSSAPYVKDFGLHWLGDIQVDPSNADHAMFTTGYGIYRTTNLRAGEPTWVFYNEGFEQSAVLELISPPSGSANLVSAIGDRDGYRHEDLNATPPQGRFGQINDRGQAENHSIGTCHDIDMAWDRPEILVRVGGPAQYSNDGGFTWVPMPYGQGRQGPRDGSVAVARDGSSALWAPRRSAVLRATRQGDGWSGWTPVEGIPAGETMLAADLGRASTFYARCADGLYISTDGGADWSKQAASLPADPSWLRATPGHEGHLWLTAGDEGRGGLHHSSDGGQTWVRVAPGHVAVAKQVGLGAPAPGRDYPSIYIGGTVDGVQGFFRSDDRGATWIRINDDDHHYGNVTVITGDSRVHGRLYVGTNGRGILYGEPAPAGR